MNPLIILIIEDSPELADMWARSLREMGCEVEAAPTMKLALSMIRRDPPHDLCLLDLSLPDTAGKEDTMEQFIGAARAVNPAIKIVVATGYATDEIRALALAMGADDFQSKMDLNSGVALYRVIKAQFDHCEGSREAVQRQLDIQEQLSKLIPVDRIRTQRLY
jgi:CheY-like chemotaxis protein